MSNNIENLLKESGFKVTSTRLGILKLFSQKSCQPLNADYIFDKIKKIDKKINLVTVYRNLVSFESKGILKRIDVHQKSVHYELANHHHHHIICQECGEIESFDDCGLKNLDAKLLRQTKKFKTIKNHSLEFFGLCKSCAK